jgi:predicted DNA-binding transcriptional regulator AlpA
MFNFSLKFKLAEPAIDENELLERLGEAGCTDAVVGIGAPGKFALEFDREADSAPKAMVSAITDVMRAIRGAKLVEATPDFVSMTEVANLVGVSRQYVRQLMAKHLESFPTAVHEGSTNIWHLAHLLSWFRTEGMYEDVVKKYYDIAAFARHVNLVKESKVMPGYVIKGMRDNDIDQLLTG